MNRPLRPAQPHEQAEGYGEPRETKPTQERRTLVEINKKTGDQYKIKVKDVYESVPPYEE